MTHKGHLMKRGLSIEDHIVIVPQMSLNDVARLEVSIRSVLQRRQIDLLIVVSQDVLGAWPIVRSIEN